MTYKELADFDSTDDQHLALQLQMKEDFQTPATTSGEYAVRVLSGILDDYAARHISSKVDAKLVDAFAKASDSDKLAVAAVLKIDVTKPDPNALAAAAAESIIP